MRLGAMSCMLRQHIREFGAVLLSRSGHRMSSNNDRSRVGPPHVSAGSLGSATAKAIHMFFPGPSTIKNHHDTTAQAAQ